jgi:lipoyl(octanoyl) transferase
MHLLQSPVTCDFQYLGLTAYADALRIMENALTTLHADQALIWGLEHPLVYTSGLKTDSGHILNEHIKVVPARRGGSVTLHNPGQLVIYFAFPLGAVQGGLERFVRVLESTLAEVLLGLGVDCNLQPGASGVFTPRGKVAFIGLGLKRGFVYHGVSVNLSNNLGDFSSIQSCGLTLPMTSVAELTQKNVTSQIFFEMFQSKFSEKLAVLTPAEFRDRVITGHDLSDSQLGFKLGWLAFHERRFWEAHELWEIYWHEMPPGDLRIFFHAMIQVAMAYYKLFTAPNLAGALSLLTKALEKLAVVGNVQLLQKQSDFVESLRAQHTLLMNAGKSAPRSEGIAHLPGIYAWQV